MTDDVAAGLAIGWFVTALVCFGWGAGVADDRRLPTWVGMLAGVLLGPVGVLLVALRARVPVEEARYRADVAAQMKALRAKRAGAPETGRDGSTRQTTESDVALIATDGYREALRKAQQAEEERMAREQTAAWARRRAWLGALAERCRRTATAPQRWWAAASAARAARRQAEAELAARMVVVQCAGCGVELEVEGGRAYACPQCGRRGRAPEPATGG